MSKTGETKVVHQHPGAQTLGMIRAETGASVFREHHFRKLQDSEKAVDIRDGWAQVNSLFCKLDSGQQI